MLAIIVAVVHASTNLALGYVYHQENSGWAVESFAMFRLAIMHVNRAQYLLPNHTLVFRMSRDTLGTEGGALASIVDVLLRDPEIIGIVGTAWSATVGAPALYASHMRLPMITPASQSPRFVDKQAMQMPFLLRSIDPQAAAVEGIIAAIHDLGWRHVAAIGARDEFGESIFQLFQRHAHAANMTVVDYVSHAPNLAGWTADGEQDTQSAIADVAGRLRQFREAAVRVFVILSYDVEVPIILRAMIGEGLLSRGYVCIVRAVQGAMSEFLSVAPAGVLYVSPQTDTSPSNFTNAWRADVTRYNASLHGQQNMSTMLPLYDPRPTAPFWDYGTGGIGDGLPDGWGVYLYDTVMIYAHALDTLLRTGGDPHNGGALRDALLATQLHGGATGHVAFDPATQDRMAQFALYNVQQTGALSPATPVRIGMLPRRATPGLAGTSPSWLETAIQYPGATSARPSDGIQQMDIDAAVILPVTQDGRPNSLGQKLVCAAMLAAAHANARNGSIVPAFGGLRPDLRLNLFAFDSGASRTSGVAAYQQAIHSRHRCNALIGPMYSEQAIPIALQSAGMPQISPTASANELTNKALYPGFARTYPADSQAALALMRTLRANFWGWTRVAVLNVGDAYVRTAADAQTRWCGAPSPKIGSASDARRLEPRDLLAGEELHSWARRGRRGRQ